MEVSFLFFGFVFLSQIVRFLGIDFSPPGFYVDEAVGAAQVLCLKETGADFFHQSYPLFSAGLGAGYYTAPYLYGEMFWTSIFGNSIYAFRTFLAFITTLTIYGIYRWVKRETASETTARFALLFATISPWAFQFSRIAWDPPLAPFFLVMAFLISKRNLLKPAWVLTALCLALASYAYPPIRVQAIVLLFFIPGFDWKAKLKTAAAYVVFLIPLFLRSLDPAFTARGKLLILWSDYPMNPYHDANIVGLFFGFLTEFLKYLTPEFLLMNGDHNVRHSIQKFGMLSAPEYFLLLMGLVMGIYYLY